MKNKTIKFQLFAFSRRTVHASKQFITMAHSTLRAKGSIKDRRQRPTKSRQDLRSKKEHRYDDNEDNVIQLAEKTLIHYEDELLKMETLFNLETHYIELQSKHDKVLDLELELEYLNRALINTRSHISRVKKLEPWKLAFTLERYYQTGDFVHINALDRATHDFVFKGEDHVEVRKRIILVNIFIARYSKICKTGKHLKKMHDENEIFYPAGQGLITEALKTGWESTKAYFSYLGDYIRKNNKLPEYIQHMKDTVSKVHDYLQRALAKFISKVSLKMISYIVLSIVVLGLVGSASYYIFKQIIVHLYSGIPFDSRFAEAVEGQGMDGKPVGQAKNEDMFAMMGQIVSHTIKGDYKFNSAAFLLAFGRQASHFNSLERCLTTVWGSLSKMASFLYNQITGEILFDVDKVPAEIERNCTLLQDGRIEFSKTQRFATKAAAENTVHAADYLKKMVAMRITTTYPALGSTITSTLVSCADYIDTATAFLFGANFRPMPVAVHLVGKPGVGKSTIMAALVRWTKYHFGKHYNDHNIRYDRKVNNEFWEGYTHQFAMTIDDFMQDKDIESRKLAALEYIYAVNPNPYHLHFAGMSDKKGQFFDSPFVVTTSNYEKNQLLPGDINITDPYAFYRRMQLKYLMFRTDAFIKNPQLQGKDALDSLNKKFMFVEIDNDGKKIRNVTFSGLLLDVGKQFAKNAADFEQQTNLDDPNVLSQITNIFEGEANHVEMKQDEEHISIKKGNAEIKLKATQDNVIQMQKDAVDSLNDDKIINTLLRLDEKIADTKDTTATLVASLEANGEGQIHQTNAEPVYEQCTCPFDCSVHTCNCFGAGSGFRCPQHWKQVCHCPFYCDLHNIYRLYGQEPPLPQPWQYPPYAKWSHPGDPMTDIEGDVIMDLADGQADDDVDYDEDDNDRDNTKKYNDAQDFENKFTSNKFNKQFDTKEQLDLLKEKSKGNAFDNNLYREKVMLTFADTHRTLEDNRLLFKNRPHRFIFDGICRMQLSSLNELQTESEKENIKNAQLIENDGEAHVAFNTLTAEMEKSRITTDTVTWREMVTQRLFDNHEQTRNSLMQGYDRWVEQVAQKLHQEGMDLVQSHEVALKQVICTLLVFMEDVLLNKCELNNPHVERQLAIFVWDYGVRARKHPNFIEFFIRQEMRLTSMPDMFLPDWQDQILYQFTCATASGVRFPEKTMKRVTLNNYGIAGTIFGIPIAKMEKTTNFPAAEGMYDMKWYIDNKIDLPVRISKKAQEKLDMARIALAIIASTAVAALLGTIIVLVTKAILYFFHRDASVMGESFDKNTEKKAKKQLNRKRPQRTKLPTRRVEGEVGARHFGKLVHGQSETVGQSHMVSLGVNFAHNTEYMAMIMEDGTTHYQFGLFIKTNICVTASHVFKTGKISKIVFMWAKVRNTMEFNLLNHEHFEVSYLKDRDSAVIHLKSGLLPPVKDLTSHLMTNEELLELKNIPNVAKVTFADDGTLMLLHAPNAEFATDIDVKYNNQVVKFATMWFVRDMPGEGGHCGLPYFTINNKFQRKLLGHHNAGVTLGSYFSPLTQEDFVEFADGQALGNVVPEALYMAETLKKTEIVFEPETKMVYEGLKTVANIYRDGKPFNYWIPNRSALQPTGILSGMMRMDLKPFTSNNPYMMVALSEKKKPAALAPCKNEKGEIVNPLSNAMSKYKGRNKPLPNIQYKAKYFNGIFHKNIDYTMIRPLTEKEVINGVKGSDFIGPADLSTSAATGLSELGLTMKDIIIGPDGQRKFYGPFAQLLQFRQENFYDKNEVPPYFGTGTLKDELRSELKYLFPRLFINGAKTSLFEAKKWMSRLFEQIVNHNGEGDIYIGINPHSRAWKTLFEKMKSKSRRKAIADDIAKWDLMMNAGKFVEDFCRRCAELGIDKTMINMWALILKSILNPYIIIGGKIYRSVQMPSGSYITAMVNSMYNSWMIRQLWDLEFPNIDFDEKIAQAIFGDDVLQTVDDNFDDDAWNGQVLARLRMKWFGMETTSIFKDGRAVPKFIPLVSTQGEESAQFIKRQFREDNDNVFPILDLNSIVGMIEWVRPDDKNGRTFKICVKDNVETALRELMYHGEEMFSSFYNYIKPIYLENKWQLPTFSYNEELLKYLGN